MRLAVRVVVVVDVMRVMGLVVVRVGPPTCLSLSMQPMLLWRLLLRLRRRVHLHGLCAMLHLRCMRRRHTPSDPRCTSSCCAGLMGLMLLLLLLLMCRDSTPTS